MTGLVARVLWAVHDCPLVSAALATGMALTLRLAAELLDAQDALARARQIVDEPS